MFKKKITCGAVYHDSASSGEDNDSDMDMGNDHMYTHTLSFSFSFSCSPSFSLMHSLSLVLSLFSSVYLVVTLFHTHAGKQTTHFWMGWWALRGIARSDISWLKTPWHCFFWCLEKSTFIQTHNLSDTAPTNKICRRTSSEQSPRTRSCHEWKRLL